jgi:hypothetical protein
LDPAEETNFNGYICPPDQPAEEAPCPQRDYTPTDDSLVGKIHQHCPSLFNTFSAYDRLFITEQADIILPADPTVSLPTQLVSPYLPSPFLPNPPEPVPPDITNTTYPPLIPQLLTSDLYERDSETQSTAVSEITPESFILDGYTEPTQSEIQLDTMLSDATPATSLPFD